MPDLTVTPGAVSGPRRVRRTPGSSTDDVDVLQAYDSFTITALLHLEDLGFCAKGEGGAFVEDGKLGPGGALPTNTNGGGLSYTHPGQYGIFLLVEAVRQLRGSSAANARCRTPRSRWRTAAAGCCRPPAPSCSARRRRCDRPPSNRRCPTRRRPFWDATREQRFVLPWCTECERRDLVPAHGLPAVSR